MFILTCHLYLRHKLCKLCTTIEECKVVHGEMLQLSVLKIKVTFPRRVRMSEDQVRAQQDKPWGRLSLMIFPGNG